jgi:hypothetical protein
MATYLNIYETQVNARGNLRTYKNVRGEGCVFNVELMDEDVSSPHVLFVNNVTYILCFSDEVF